MVRRLERKVPVINNADPRHILQRAVSREEPRKISLRCSWENSPKHHSSWDTHSNLTGGDSFLEARRSPWDSTTPLTQSMTHNGIGNTREADTENAEGPVFSPEHRLVSGILRPSTFAPWSPGSPAALYAQVKNRFHMELCTASVKLLFRGFFPF